MALSNWDTMALDENSIPTNGIIVSKDGVIVEIYKNWLYVRDAKAWYENGPFIKHTIMQILEGDIRYRDVHIVAKRGPKNGIYVLVETPVWGEGQQLMVGIGCYGYSETEDKWVGIGKEEIDFLHDMLHAQDDYGYIHSELVVGIDLSKALRFNQGDAYFSTQLGDEVPATKPGDGEEPFLMQLLRKKDEP